MTQLKSARVDPASGAVIADPGQAVDPQVESAARAIRDLVRDPVQAAEFILSTDHSGLPFPGPRGADLEWMKVFLTVYHAVRQLEAGDEAGAEQSVLRCAAEADNPPLAANCALATAGFLLGVTGVAWAALGLAAGDRVIACNCWTCDPPEHYTPRR